MKEQSRILVIEDNRSVAEEIVSILEFEGFNVFMARSGKEGLKLAQKEFPELILSDVSMPGMDGFELLAELRKNPFTSLIPFIFLTAKVEIKDLRQGMNLGADDYLMKPVSAEELLSAVRTRLEKAKEALMQMEQLRKNILQYLPHEFNTPLMGIIGFSDLLNNNFDSYEIPLIKEMLGNIHESGQRLQKLIYKYLYLNRIEVNSMKKYEFKDAVKNPAELLEIIAHLVADKWSRSEDLNLGVLENFSVSFPAELLRLVFGEIIENAFKFSEKGETVSIMMVSESRQVIIRDEGIGFNKENIPQIGAYMQFDRNIREQQGAGLGLTLAKKAMNIYGDSLRVQPEEKGTSVVFNF